MIPLTDAEKTDIRRYCGYPPYGSAPAGFQTWRFYQVYGLLEFRMNNLSQAEVGVARRYLVHVALFGECDPTFWREFGHRSGRGMDA